MAIDSVAASLLRIPIFAGLKPLQITEIARQAVHRIFRRGDIIIKAGMPGDAAYLVLSGEAERRPGPGSRAAPEPIDPGSLVGELAMLVEHVYGTTVAAAGGVHCLKIGRTELHLQMLADPDLATRLARVVKDRLVLLASELQGIDRLLRRREAAPPVATRAAAWPPPLIAQAASTRAQLAVTNEKRPTPGEELGAEARHAHSARREAGT